MLCPTIMAATWPDFYVIGLQPGQKHYWDLAKVKKMMRVTEETFVEAYTICTSIKHESIIITNNNAKQQMETFVLDYLQDLVIIQRFEQSPVRQPIKSITIKDSAGATRPVKFGYDG